MPKASLEIALLRIIAPSIKLPSMVVPGGALLFKFCHLIIDSRWWDFVAKVPSSDGLVLVTDLVHRNHLPWELASKRKIVLDRASQEGRW